jgi:hypothetical protein
MKPPVPAAIIIHIGLTPNSQINNAPPAGIQQFVHVIWVLLANLNVEIATRATTAGRIPQNMALMK